MMLKDEIAWETAARFLVRRSKDVELAAEEEGVVTEALALSEP